MLVELVTPRPKALRSNKTRGANTGCSSFLVTTGDGGGASIASISAVVGIGSDPWVQRGDT